MSLLQLLQELLGSQYTLERELGGGGMSRVFVARDEALRRDVVVKVLPPDLATSSSAARFVREVEFTARLQHPHILPVIAAGGDARLLYYITPYVRGESLRSQLASGQRPSADEAFAITFDLLSAVAFAHRNGIVHRDIKPGNVLLSDGHAILADFGIAHALDAADDAGQAPSATAGEAARPYVAPERPRDAAADLYGVAAVVHEMFTGSPPGQPVLDSVIRAALRAAHPAIAAAQSAAVSRVLATALAIDPARRYPTAEALRQAFVEAGDPKRARRPVASAVAAAVGVLVIAVSWAMAPGGTSGRASAADRAGEGVIAAPWADTQTSATTARPAGGMAGPWGLGEALAPEMDGRASESDRTADVGNGEVAGQADDTTAVVPTRSLVRALLDSALMLGWSDDPATAELARQTAARTLAQRGALDPPDVALAEGLLALGERRYAEACSAFARAREARADFDAWLGSGECLRRDNAVVLSASGELVFRTSYAQAAEAYIQATRVAGRFESASAYLRLLSVLPTEPGRVRMGITADGRQVIGEPVMAGGDTLSYRAAPPGPRRLTADDLTARERAAAAARDRLRPLLVAWTQTAPDKSIAHELLAQLLESDGHVNAGGPDRVTALGEIRAARRTASEAASRLRLATIEVRLLLRSRDYATAGELADSLLRAHLRPDLQDASRLLSLAMVGGQLARATALLEMASGLPGRGLSGPDGQPVTLPATVVRERAAFVTAATLGVCTDAVRAAPARLLDVLDAFYPAGARPRGTESAYLERPLALAANCVGSDAFALLRDPSPVTERIRRALDPAMRAAVRAEFAAVDRSGAVTGGFASTESMVVEAQMRLATGDSAGARRALRRGIDAIPAAPNAFMTNEVLAGTFVRAMAELALLADGAGERSEARAMAEAVLALWLRADPELQPLLERLRRIAASS